MKAQSATTTNEEILAGFPRFVWRALTVLGVLAALSVAIYGFGAFYGDRMARAGHSTDTSPLEIIISNDAYLIPKNMIRHEDQRVGGGAERIDTYVHWPSQSGYTSELAAQFSSSDPDTIELVFLSFSERKSFLDMTDRFAPVYRSAIDDSKIKVLSNGLFVAPLSPEYGYISERLVYSRNDERGKPQFIARCQASPEQNSRLLLPCETDIFVGETSEMKVRFPAAQLQRWQEFSKELESFAARLIASN